MTSRKMTDKEARNILRWAQWLADRMGCNEGPFGRDDLVQIAIYKALRVFKDWDPRRGSLFTFMVPRMRGVILDTFRDYMLRNGHTQKHVYRDYNTIRFGVLEGRYRRLANGESADIFEMFFPEEEREPLSDIRDSIQQWRKAEGLKGLPWKVFCLRYGLELSCQDIGKQVGLSTSRISQLLTRLRKRYPWLPRTIQHPVSREKRVKASHLRNLRKKGRRQ